MQVYGLVSQTEEGIRPEVVLVNVVVNFVVVVA
jgi:hypothetical protein